MGVIVIGCGVSGLSCGIRLLEEGHNVAIWARDLPPHTTSNVAAAVWYPYRAFPIEAVLNWGQSTFEVFRELAGVPETGVTMAEGLEFFREPAPDPWWRECVGHFRRAAGNELPPGYSDGYVFETSVIEMSIYLGYLMRRFQGLGGVIEQHDVLSIDEPLAESRVVVNCAGLGARTLVGDESLFPIRGQIVLVDPLPMRRFILDEGDDNGSAYIVPRSSDCVLGGIADVGDWSLEADGPTASAIIERCARLLPEAREAKVLGHMVGLRPGRPTVRLEVEPQRGGGVVIHNYGHGGAGVTLSWGCAEEVVSLVADAIA
ncbi:MAG TPA: FAD-dependent oxidoreductase [Chloroflexia bacterium]|nr:FAD-dependent oxidoreductase [Chloroflexia bacterium]